MRNKFNARMTHCLHGHKHASRKEANRCVELHLLQSAGQICGLKVEPRFHFHVNGREVKMRNGQVARYTPDFTYVENGKQVAEDIKGGSATITEAAALRIALFRTIWPEIELRLVK